MTIEGHGVVRPLGGGREAGIRIADSQRVMVRGVVVNQCPVGGSSDVMIENVKAITHYGWGDGFNVFASSNISYRNIFARTSDDCQTVYATRKGFTGGARNIRVEGAVLWADIAHPVMIGIHGNAEGQDVIEDLVYRDIDILDQHENQIEYQGCMTINCGDNNLVRVMDVMMPELDGFATIERLRRFDPKVKVLLLSGMPLKADEDRARELKICGYLPKSVPWRRLVSALHEIAEGRRDFIGESYVEQKSCLTDRELEVLKWTAQGKTREEIAVIIGISAETVKTHAKSVMRKLDAVNNVSAVARAYELGILRA